MLAVDTNVIVRLIVRDDERQAAAAEEAVREGAWLSILGLAETVWVLSSVYEFTPTEVIHALEMLLENEQLTVEHSPAVERALALNRGRPRVRFADCLMIELARQAGCLPLATFDRDLAKLEDVELLRS
jgi:predicted nucleic-acid-binding protein